MRLNLKINYPISLIKTLLGFTLTFYIFWYYQINKSFKMNVTRNTKHSSLIEMLPPEILEKIFKLLNHIDIRHAKLMCKRWKEIIDNGNLVKKALGKISCIIAAGGYQGMSEILRGDLESKQLPNLPNENFRSMVHHNESILIFGQMGEINNQSKCFQLDNGIWKNHSTLNKQRYGASAVATPVATFLFGGLFSRKTYEYLPNGSTTWLIGKIDIADGGIFDGCAIAVKSGSEILLFGGSRTLQRIISFNVNDHTFQVMDTGLNVGRRGFSCAFIPNTNKIMITGGWDKEERMNTSTEIFDTENGSITTASPINCYRSYHGMGVLTVNGEDKLALLGGYGGKGKLVGGELNSVEIYNTKTKEWDKTNIKLKHSNSKSGFGFLAINHRDLISKL